MINTKELAEAIIGRMRKELPQGLFYHSVEHTLDVAIAAEHLAREEKLSANERLLVEVAALFHDSGFINDRENHEAGSCQLAGQMLPVYNYSPQMVDEVCRMIMATKIPQAPLDKLSEVLCDADLDYLGREDYFMVAPRLKKELIYFSIIRTDAEWKELQIGFFNAHRYFTPSARRLRDAGKARNLAILQDIK